MQDIERLGGGIDAVLGRFLQSELGALDLPGELVQQLAAERRIA